MTDIHPADDAARDAAVVRAGFAAYIAQDRAGAEALIADDFVFASPRDERLDRAEFFTHCWPTAARFAWQRVLETADAGPGLVFVRYEYELRTGERYRNVEVQSVRAGRITAAEVYFGGRVG